MHRALKDNTSSAPDVGLCKEPLLCKQGHMQPHVRVRNCCVYCTFPHWPFVLLYSTGWLERTLECLVWYLVFF
jgi:hypothetical protein